MNVFAGNKCDVASTAWTGLWRTGGDYDAGRPENELTGQVSWTESTDDAIKVPSYYKKLRFWRNTSIPSMSTGKRLLLGLRRWVMSGIMSITRTATPREELPCPVPA
jgi:hypothetical protein